MPSCYGDMVGAYAGQCLHQRGHAVLYSRRAAALTDNGYAQHAGCLYGLHKSVCAAAAQKHMGGAAVAVCVRCIDALTA